MPSAVIAGRSQYPAIRPGRRPGRPDSAVIRREQPAAITSTGGRPAWPRPSGSRRTEVQVPPAAPPGPPGTAGPRSGSMPDRGCASGVTKEPLASGGPQLTDVCRSAGRQGPGSTAMRAWSSQDGAVVIMARLCMPKNMAGPSTDSVRRRHGPRNGRRPRSHLRRSARGNPLHSNVTFYKSPVTGLSRARSDQFRALLSLTDHRRSALCPLMPLPARIPVVMTCPFPQHWTRS